MVDQCCGAAKEQCCLGGQKCYTYYETKCERVDQPFCTRRTQEFCDTEMLPDCRTTKETKYTSVPHKVCQPKMERKCFDYEVTGCQPKRKTITKTFTWDEQELEKTGERKVRKCHPVKTCTIKNVPYSKTIQVPEQKCEDIPVPKQECRSIPIPGRARQVPQTAYRTEYTQRCYTVNRPRCTQAPQDCTNTGCQNYGDVCSTHQFQQQDVCADGGGYCQQVQMPQCFQSATQCQTGSDQCCQMSQEKVCQQVPKRVPFTTYTTIQEPTTYRQECNTVQTTRRQCRTIYKPKAIPMNRKVCDNSVENKCYDYTIPEVIVKPVTDSEDVKFDTMDCEKTTATRKYCVDLPTSQTCRDQNVQRGVVIHKKVCDRRRPTKFCTQIPVSECQSNSGQQCYQVPKQVCQPACSQSSNCQQCQNFIGQGGYGQCPQSTCPNFYPPSPCGQSPCAPVANLLSQPTSAIGDM